MSVTGVFYREDRGGDTMLKVGGASVINLEGNSSEVLAFNFNGAFLSGEFIKQNISIKNRGEKDLFIRAKLTVFTGDNDDPVLELKTSEGWKKQEDGRYLFEGYLSSLNSMGLCSGFEISPEKQLQSTSAYIIAITVEGLTVDFDRMAVWGY